MAAAESSSVVNAEALSCTLCLSSENRAYLKEEQKLAIFSLFSWREVFVWLPMGLGKSICFQMIPAAHSAGIKKKKTQLNLVHSVRVTLWRKCHHNHNEYD